MSFGKLFTYEVCPCFLTRVGLILQGNPRASALLTIAKLSPLLFTVPLPQKSYPVALFLLYDRCLIPVREQFYKDSYEVEILNSSQLCFI